MNVVSRCPRIISNVTQIRRSLKNVTSNNITENTTDKLRNIGILAHIDAGKTTTTERMLYYSGTIRSMGEVHHGNTVTDFMEQERQRGITIASAAVSFGWNDHQFNLIDTPGHIDFTMEVEQSLGVLDGAVVILDASAGVEAQTLTVWRQCDNHRLPRIIYVNKMDRSDADIKMCMESLRQKLDINPLCLHIPIKDNSKKLIGLIDIIKMEYLLWDADIKGAKFISKKLTESADGLMWESAISERRNVTDVLSGLNDELADHIIQSDSLDNIDTALLINSLRNSTIKQEIYPVLCGSSYKNVGVQPLMNCIIDYLPSPLESNQIYSCFGKDLSAKAFKVQHDDQKGVLTYFRIFSGNLNKGQKIFNIPKQRTEQAGILYIPYADEYEIVNKIDNGNVAVLSGLKETMTGDIITSSQSAATVARKKLLEIMKDSDKMKKLNIPPVIKNKILANADGNTDSESAVATILGMGATIPDPVFLCSIEPPSLAYQTALDIALAELQREDPSLRVTNNPDTAQTVLAGMGELHLEIIKERILTEYKIDAELGPLQIAYKETLKSIGKESHTLENTIGGSKHSVNITLSAYPIDNTISRDVLKLDSKHDSASNLAHIYPKNLQAIRNGVDSALLSGPKLSCPMVDVGVTLHWFETTRGTTETTISAAVTQCLRKIFKSTESMILEPIMFLEVVCPEDYVTRLTNDLHRRRAIIQHFGIRGKYKVIECYTPLSELMGYSTDIRSLSSGTATFTMEFHTNVPMSSIVEDKAIKSLRGF